MSRVAGPREFAVEAVAVVLGAEGRTRRSSDEAFFGQIVEVLGDAEAAGEEAAVWAVLHNELGLHGMWQVVYQHEKRRGPCSTGSTREVLSLVVRHHTPAAEIPLDPDEVTCASQEELAAWVVTRRIAEVMRWGVWALDDTVVIEEYLTRCPQEAHIALLRRYLEISGADAVRELVVRRGTVLCPRAVATIAALL
jgi:hypothetical protein